MPMGGRKEGRGDTTTHEAIPLLNVSNFFLQKQTKKKENKSKNKHPHPSKQTLLFSHILKKMTVNSKLLFYYAVIPEQ